MEQIEQWANEVLVSIEGFERARPSDTLFAKINSQLTDKVQSKIIPIRKLYWLAIAACAVLVLNIFAFSSEMSEISNVDINNQQQAQLLTDFTIYE